MDKAKYRRIFMLSTVSLGAVTVSSCATVASEVTAMSPCEKAAIARAAAVKVIEAVDTVCPLQED